MNSDQMFTTSFPAFVISRGRFRWRRGVATLDTATVRWTPIGEHSGETDAREASVASIRQVAVDFGPQNKLDISLWGDFGMLHLTAGSKVFPWRSVTALRAVTAWLAAIGFTKFRRPGKSRFGYGRRWLCARSESDIDWELSEGA